MEDLDFEPTIKFIEKQARKGKGKRMIMQEIRGKGLPSNEDLFDDIDFFEIASDYKQKKYGEGVETDPKIKNKKTQHMLSRGFSFDEIKEALSS